MENSKSKPGTKTTVKAKKPAASEKAEATKKAKTTKSTLTEDDIRAKAQEIYNDRILKGVSGTPEEDWLKAEALLRR